MPADPLSRLEAWKRSFGTADPGDLEDLLETLAAAEFFDADSLIRLHETLLFLRAYPPSLEAARRADVLLNAFDQRLARFSGDTAAFEEGEASGIAGTTFSAVFSFEAARSLVRRHPRDIEINYDAWDSSNAGAVLRRLIPLMGEDWPVEAHVPYSRWIEASRRKGESGARWLIEAIARLSIPAREQAELYDSLRLPLLWSLGASEATRSRMRAPSGELFPHNEPLIRRAAVSVAAELAGPPLEVARVPRRVADRLLDAIMDTSAVRYRELYGFNHPDPQTMLKAELGRGMTAYLFGVAAEDRLPLRAYHSGMYFKNGVPCGYIEVLSLFERAEVGFNLYYTFREGESAWLYARLMKLLHQSLGVTCFSVDPYQIGDENPEAIDSGAFWFYRKLGFRPLDGEVRRLLAREERRMAREPGRRSGPPTLKRLARGYILWDGRGDEPGEMDGFRVRNIGLRAAAAGLPVKGGIDTVARLIPEIGQWPEADRAALRAIRDAKQGPDETRYLRLTQRHRRLRAAVLTLGAER
ncbi:MAG: hypothetical protein JSU00_12770 [Acidobacteria bacterium]|nr:hypothetical protein [Acidobacteriota bacterium]